MPRHITFRAIAPLVWALAVLPLPVGAETKACAWPERFFAAPAGADAADGAAPWAAALSPGRAPASCTTDRGGPFCRWEFDLGQGGSRTLFDTLSARMEACIASGSIARDPGVNHPDSYRVLILTRSGHVLTLVLKDKSALGQSFVTLRVATEP